MKMVVPVDAAYANEFIALIALNCNLIRRNVASAVAAPSLRRISCAKSEFMSLNVHECSKRRAVAIAPRTHTLLLSLLSPQIPSPHLQSYHEHDHCKK